MGAQSGQRLRINARSELPGALNAAGGPRTSCGPTYRHRQEQAHRIHAGEGVGQAGGEMSRVLKVRTQGGNIIPGLYSFQLRAARVDSTSTGRIIIQADRTYPTEIR